jgi:DNA-3-methyladenine glycosylase I
MPADTKARTARRTARYAASPVPGTDPPNEFAGPPRCPWATGDWLTPYHDEEWGVPVHDDRLHFEHLSLEGAQAGLSWLTVLKRRQAYRKAFAGFEPEKVARFGDAKIDALLADEGIIRNRKKVESVVANAVAMCELRARTGTFDAFLWDRVDGHPIVNTWRSLTEVPASTPLSEMLSRDLRRLGFRFVGPVVCYSHLQSVGIVMDHLTACFRYADLARPTPGSG